MIASMGFMRGLPGRGIASASFSAEQGITLTFSDASTFQTGALRGAQGAQGQTGEQGLQGPAGADGAPVVVTDFTDEAAFDAHEPGPNEIVNLYPAP